MSDAEWLRGIADSGWNNDEWPPGIKALLRRAADGLDELAAARAEPPRPAAIVQVIGGHFHGFESDTDALAFRNERDDVGISQHSVCYSWTWHARAAEGEGQRQG